LCSVLDWDHLVTDGSENRGEEGEEVWLDGSGCFRVLSDSLDGIESAFSYVGILLVSELFLESFDGSVKDT
jgi:hypothetical protein